MEFCTWKHPVPIVHPFFSQVHIELLSGVRIYIRHSLCQRHIAPVPTPPSRPLAGLGGQRQCPPPVLKPSGRGQPTVSVRRKHRTVCTGHDVGTRAPRRSPLETMATGVVCGQVNTTGYAGMGKDRGDRCV